MNRISWKTRTVGLVALVTVAMAHGTANAGDQLRFKTGAVRTKNIQSGPGWIRDGIKNAVNARYFIVQFKSKITKNEHQQLKTLGIKALRYIPEDALLVEADAEAAEQLSKSKAQIQAVLPFLAEWKVSPEFGPSSVFSAKKKEQILIRTLDAKLQSEITRGLEQSGAKIDFADGRSIVATVNRRALDSVAKLEGIEWIQPAPEMKLMHWNPLEDGGETPPPATGTTEEPPKPKGDYTDLDGHESGAQIMNFEDAYARGFQGDGQTVGMADTGLDRGDLTNLHGDFSGRVTGQAFGMFASGWEDPMGHGTHVAGSIVGDGNVSGGKLVGGAPKARFVAQSMWSPLLGNLTVPPKLADMFGRAYQDGARIHSNSWGSPRNLGVYDAFAVQVDEYMFANPDFLLIFAAGNSGSDANKDGRIDEGSVSTPGTAKNSLTVGASENLLAVGGIQKKLGDLRGGKDSYGVEPIKSDTLSDDPNGIAAFSSRGPTQDGRLKPDVVAPGTNILSTASKHPDAEELWGRYNADYVYSGGTSMATPLVAGAAAVVREYLVKEKKLETPSAALVKNVLMHSAVDLFPGQFGEVGKSAGQEMLTHRPNVDEGWGRVDVKRATSFGKALLVDEKAGVATEEAQVYELNVTREGKITVSLVWTDAPGSPNATTALVNDLDIVLIDAAGKETKTQDRINNSEIIETAVTPGLHKVQVKGFNVPQGVNGKQPYSLVVSIQ